MVNIGGANTGNERRGLSFLVFVGIIGFSIARAIATFFTNYLWFDSVDLNSVWIKILLTKSILVAATSLLAFAFIFVKNFNLVDSDIFIVPLMCVLCVAIPFVLVTIAPRFITASEVNLFFLLEVIIGPIWVWIVISERPSLETIIGGIIIIITIAIHSFLALKKT